MAIPALATKRAPIRRFRCRIVIIIDEPPTS
jgi:hypothetical protein